MWSARTLWSISSLLSSKDYAIVSHPPLRCPIRWCLLKALYPCSSFPSHPSWSDNLITSVYFGSPKHQIEIMSSTNFPPLPAGIVLNFCLSKSALLPFLQNSRFFCPQLNVRLFFVSLPPYFVKEKFGQLPQKIQPPTSYVPVRILLRSSLPFSFQPMSWSQTSPPP